MQPEQIFLINKRITLVFHSADIGVLLSMNPQSASSGTTI